MLKINKTVNYPRLPNADPRLYQNNDGAFANNPFNLNEDFSEFKQIFVSGYNFSKLSIYKSMVQPNTFLLISKVYNLSKDLNTMKPCVTTIFHAYEEGTGTAEEISKISFQFAIGPNLSDFDLAKLKIALLQNNFLDGDTTDYFDKIQFLFPNDISAEYEVSGNYFLQQSDITTDGKHFLFNLSTENLSEAQIAEIKSNFDFFDRDGNGRIELTEFIELLTALAPKTKASHVEEGFKLIDTNNNGYIDFAEFLDWWQDCWWEY